jgi:hypothetical protein
MAPVVVCARLELSERIPDKEMLLEKERVVNLFRDPAGDSDPTRLTKLALITIPLAERLPVIV